MQLSKRVNRLSPSFVEGMFCHTCRPAQASNKATARRQTLQRGRICAAAIVAKVFNHAVSDGPNQRRFGCELH